jgi:hypothetical protein
MADLAPTDDELAAHIAAVERDPRAQWLPECSHCFAAWQRGIYAKRPPTEAEDRPSTSVAAPHYSR